MNVELKFLFMMLSTCVIGFSCRRESENYGKTTYEGKVYERGSDVGIPNCVVYIHGKKTSMNFSSGDLPVIAQTYSDASGHYSIQFYAEKDELYYIYPESKHHAGNSKGQAVWRLTEFGKTVRKDLEQWTYGYVKMKMLNKKHHRDYTHIYLGGQLNGGILYPNNEDTVFTGLVWGNQPDTMIMSAYSNDKLIRKAKYGFLVKAWHTDSVTIEY